MKITTVVAVVFSFIACEDDFQTIGSNVIGAPNFSAELYDDAEIFAWSNDLAPVQTNNLPSYLLGVYEDQLFGKQTASILTQLALARENPSFGDQPVIDSVVMYIPYFSREILSGTEGAEFVLDSVYGDDPIKLSIVETNFFLNQFDPETNFEQAQKYYSNLEPRIEENLTPNVLFETESFTPSRAKVVEFPVNEAGVRDTILRKPALRVKLDAEFFQKKILDMGGTSELRNQNNFKDYFRSIYIKAEETGSDGSMMLLDLSQAEAGITLYYTNQIEDTNDSDGDADSTETVNAYQSYQLTFNGTKVNTFDQEVPEFGDTKNLFLKGGEGSMAIIELFSGEDANNDNISDELEFIRESNWLVNEANLEFFVNREYMTGLNEPERIFLYDLSNNTILADYVMDNPSQTNALTSNSNASHLQPLKRDENGNGISYKVQLTRHINNIINNDSTNTRLGLVVTQNVNLVRHSAVLQTESTDVRSVPRGEVITPRATVLYGPDAEDAEKRLKLRIYYTEPKN